MPLLSIVTVNLNDRAGLARTLTSIARQGFTDREVIVIDGGSTDGSVEVIRAHAAVVTDWVSEPDGGIFEAQNKGLARASGTYCLFLNGGDAFASDDALERFFAAGAPFEDILYGDVVIEEEDGRRHVDESPDTLSWAFFMRTSLPHQSSLFRRSLFERVGPYDTGLRIAADYAFFLKAVVVCGATTRHVPVALAIQVMGGRSSAHGSWPLVRKERLAAKERVLSPVLRAHWEEYLRARRGPVVHWIRTTFRPTARRLRGWSRRVRGKVDSPI